MNRPIICHTFESGSGRHGHACDGHADLAGIKQLSSAACSRKREHGTPSLSCDRAPVDSRFIATLLLWLLMAVALPVAIGQEIKSPEAIAAEQAAAETAEAESAIRTSRETLSNKGDYPWYDAEQDALTPIELPPAKAEPKPLSVPKGFFDSLTILGWSLLALLVAALIAALIYAVIKYRQVPKEAKAAKSVPLLAPDQVEALPFLAERPKGDLLSLARFHYEQGNYSEAIIYLFSYQLLELDKFSLIRLGKGKTNRQYLRELTRVSPLSPPLERTMVAFESVFFGRQALDRGGFEACWQELPQFENLLRGAT